MHILHWRKSTYSGDSSNCVEVATAPGAIHIRDSKAAAGPHLSIRSATWADFLAYATEAAGPFAAR